MNAISPPVCPFAADMVQRVMHDTDFFSDMTSDRIREVCAASLQTAFDDWCYDTRRSAGHAPDQIVGYEKIMGELERRAEAYMDALA